MIASECNHLFTRLTLQKKHIIIQIFFQALNFDHGLQANKIKARKKLV